MNESYQNFNYHTHTKRCSHAGNYEDAEYVYYARLMVFLQLGLQTMYLLIL